MTHVRVDDGLELAVRRFGTRAGLPVVLQHGFAGESVSEWVDSGLVAALVADGRDVVTVDARGHGLSDSPRGAQYGEPRMAQDLAALIDQLGVDEVDVAGYSMGAVAVLLLAAADRRVRNVVVGGVGAGVVECGGVDQRVFKADELARAFRAADGDHGVDPARARLREIVLAGGGDPLVLAAVADAMHRDDMELSKIDQPVTVIAGDGDALAGRPALLADALRHGRLIVVNGDHTTARHHPAFAEALVRGLRS
ncbi:Tropinesterase [Microbacterium lemovicicum]|uniref:Tropinesterase n=2 Tax=Microbacterium lemovicicum TaxID=1072463 RepID=A0A3Q9J4G7_9MICO|nr:Tropinesterase [Microbacterium lemovicicum]